MINAIAAHHGDVASSTLLLSWLLADKISSARPGARSDSLDSFIHRLEKLEDIGNQFDGVEKTLPFKPEESSGHCKPDKITDLDAIVLARDIKKRIESELDYPGHIKVSVIREVRSVEYAK